MRVSDAEIGSFNPSTSVVGSPSSSSGHDPFLCPVTATLDLLSSRWTLHIIRSLLEGDKRFNELQRELGVNPRTLRARLVALEGQGAVSRTVVSVRPPNVQYALTQKGLALNCIFEALADWGRTWMSPSE